MGSAEQRRTPEQEGEQPTLSQVGKLLLYDELLIKWAANDPSRIPLFKTVYGCVGRLESETGWDLEVLLQRLGCNTEKEDFDEKLTPRRLAMCTEYMEWVEDLLEGFDLEFDKRVALKGASSFYEATGEDLLRAKEIVAEGSEPDLYLRLGEIAQAWKAAMRQLEGPDGDRARRIHDSNRFIDESTPHIRLERMKMLASPDAARMLGSGVAERMGDHVVDCPRCAPAWSRLRDRAELGSSGVLR
jgi:hypothetical protein